MSLTNYSEFGLLQRILGIAPSPNLPTFVQPTSVFLGILRSAPGENGGGDEVPTTEEIDGTTGATGYARQPVVFGVTAGDPSVAANTNNVTFIVPAAGASGLGTVTHAAIYDQATAGNMLVYFTLKSGMTDSPATVGSDAQLQFPIGSITVSLD